MNPGSMRILLVEDNPGDARLLEWYLSKPGSDAFHVNLAERLSDALRELAAARFDLVLLDLSLPDSSGLDTVRNTRRAAGMTPIVVMTMLDDEETALAALRDGAQDYLVKGKFDNRELTRSLRHAIERERAEQALRQTKEALEAIVAASPAAVLSLDTTGHVVTWNESAESIFGWTAAEAVGRIPRFISAENEAEFSALLRQVLAGDPVSDLEAQRPRKDGALIDVSLSINRICGTDGAASGAVAVLADVTARKQAEAELAKYRDHLEELVHARTHALELANKELEDFAYSVSHDLRAPLRAINGFARALQEDYAAQLDPVASDYLDRMRAASRGMAELIDGLLDLARVARLPLERKPVNLGELARTIAGELRRAEPTRQVELVIPDDMVATADPAQAAILLRNLLENAWKFTSKHPTARIEVGKTVHDGEPVWFVRDDGAGFDAAYVDNLSRPFQRLHGPADFAGTGIGLATVQRIVRRHGGRGWIEGAVEKGATYYFTFVTANREA